MIARVFLDVLVLKRAVMTSVSSGRISVADSECKRQFVRTSRIRIGGSVNVSPQRKHPNGQHNAQQGKLQYHTSGSCIAS